MRFLQLLRNVIKMNDLFYATEMLRYDGELQYRSITGGLLSLGIMIAVIVGFASMIINTLSLNTINFVENVSKDITPRYSRLSMEKKSKFMMAVQIWGVDMSSSKRYFDVLMIQLNTSSGQRDYNYSFIPLESCTRQHWADFPQISSQYEELSMSNWLCPPINTIVPLSGDFTSNLYQYVNISVNPCLNWLHPNKPCANASQVQALFASFHDALRFKIYYTNPLINAGQKEFKSYYLESSNYINFGSTIGGEAFLYLADYSVVTDNSIWPYSNMLTDKGIFIEDKLIFHPYTTFQSTYASYYLVKSPTTYTYQRVVQKISTVFSFIGGLISAISAALFILKIYNNLAFEVSLAICIFKPQEKEKDVDLTNLSLNFYSFFKFYFFHFLRKIGKKPNWPNTSFQVDCQSQIVKQLDIKALVKRVIFLEYCMTNLFEDYQLEGLQIQKPKTPSDICKIRQKCESLDTYQQHFEQPQNDAIEINFENQSVLTFQRDHNDKILDATSKFNELISPANLYDKNIDGEIADFTGKSVMDKNQQFSQIFNQKPAKPDKKIEKKKRSIIQLPVSGGKRRSINLSILKKNAEEGNPLSKKIWNQLYSKNQQLNEIKPRWRKLV